MTEPMPYNEAHAVDIATAADDVLTAAWHSHASYISYLHADDSARDWKFVPPVAERARAIEVEMRNRGLPRPEGNYLMTNNDRINWETGEWSKGWFYKAQDEARKAEQEKGDAA